MKQTVTWLIAALTAAAAQPLAAQTTANQPDSATVAAGNRIYHGRGLCATCHGSNGEGLLGPDTRLDAGKKKWLHQDGTLAGIIKMITTGIDAEHSSSGNAMPPRGGSRLTDEQIRQVAAYVLVLHKKEPVSDQ